MVAKNEAYLKQQIMRIKNMESQIEFLISEARASKAYAASNPLQPSIMTSSGHPTFNSGMYRSGMQTPRHAMMAEQSIKIPDQRRSMIPSAARTRRQSPPSNRDEHISIPAKLMQPRQGGLENIPKQIKRPPQIHQYQKPPMIDLRDDSDNLKLGKRMVVNGDVENIDEESPQQYRASHKLVKR
jgi:hypothetical protein